VYRDVHFRSGISPSFVLSVAIDASDSLFGTAALVRDCPLGARLCNGGTVSVKLSLSFLGDNCGCGCVGMAVDDTDDFDLFSFLWTVLLLLPCPSAFGGALDFFPGPSFVRLLLPLFDDAVDPEEECPLLRLGLEEVVTTVILDDELPKRRDSWSNVLSVSARDAFDSSIRDS
jgi:hypothetical protein